MYCTKIVISLALSLSFSMCGFADDVSFMFQSIIGHCSGALLVSQIM
ncbi:hypothetical protein RchiOBHm_Chr6g0279981 [Rosa chinensis]|uniref:Uncharacterized protein n=1 Tax=Rosa chinensis TaxID=74649 RepID=A0A2P6PT59_ROSCH|nr:hypothetical protein RchiOBHm_Chr6g0279981 [Rosa chinensis]